MSKNGMIMLPREVVEQALEALTNGKKVRNGDGGTKYQPQLEDVAMYELRAALEQPQPDPYLYYDPENGDTWTQEAINDGCCLPDGLIPLYTKETK